MKKVASVLSAIVIAALVMAIPVTAYAKGKTHDMKGEVVSVDATAKTLTFKDEKGESHTAPLLGAAVEEAKSLKQGDKITCTCQDSDKGEHEGVKAIKKS